LKKALYIILGIIGTLIIASGLIYYLSTPRYVVEADELCINNGMSVSPARINVTNLWKYRPLEYIIELKNLKPDCNYLVRPDNFLREGYIKLNKENYKVTIYPTDFSGIESQNVKVKIERLTWNVWENQCQTINVSETDPNKKGAVVIGLAYNVVILIE